MTTDFLGNPLSSTREETAAAIDDFVHGFLAYETKAVNVLGAADADPGDALANAYAAFLWMFSEAAGAEERAAPYAARAHAAERASPRERAAVDVARAWSGGDVARAAEIARAGLEAFPRDLTLLKLYQYFRFNEGRSDDMLEAAAAVAERNADCPYMHGMIAFAYEQCHRLDEAEAAARRALGIQAKEPWAQHALAHVMLTQGRIAEGAEFLEGVQETWRDLNSFMDTHLWWHLALFDLSLGRPARALDHYDRHVWGREKTYSQDQVGAVSLLTRMEISGIDAGPRWADVGAYLAARTEDVVNPFLTLQYLYGLARAGLWDEARALRGAVDRAAATSEVWRDVAAPAARGLLAYAEGAWAAAAQDLGAALPRMQEAGGSHAQRDLFDLIHLDALMRAGAHDRALKILETRRAMDPDGVPVNRQLADTLAALGRPDAAEAARARAAATEARFGQDTP